MTSFHISRKDGMVRQCKAQSPENCTADTPSEIKEHFTSKEEAEKAYEKVMEESRTPQSLTKRNNGTLPRRTIIGPDNIVRPAPQDPAVTKAIENLMKKEKNPASKAENTFQQKRDENTALLESAVLKNIDKLGRTNYVIENIDSYDGLPGGKAAILVNETHQASQLAKEIFESASIIQKSKNLFSKEHLNQHKENYMNQLSLEEKAIKARKRDLNRRYGFFKRMSDPDSKLVYNDNMGELTKRQQEIEQEKRTHNFL